jgi:hypothetical protein
MGKKFAAIAITCSLVWLFGFSERPEVSPPVYDIKDGAFAAESLPPLSPQDDEASRVISQVNAQNRAVRTVAADHLAVKTRVRAAKLDGRLAYEKPSRFEMTVSSQLGKELEVGSNDTHIWFSSRQYGGGALHYCKHDEIDRAKLKAPFDPRWLITSFGYDEIDTANAVVIRHKDRVAVIRLMRTANGQETKVVTLIDVTTPRVAGCYMYDSAERLMASTEAVKWDGSGVYPCRWVMYFYEEGASMELELLHPRINSTIPQDRWLMPSYRNQVNLAVN